MSDRHRPQGEGLSEYIVILALIAIAAIAVGAIFGNVVREPVGNVGDSSVTADDRPQPAPSE